MLWGGAMPISRILNINQLTEMQDYPVSIGMTVAGPLERNYRFTSGATQIPRYSLSHFQHWSKVFPHWKLSPLVQVENNPLSAARLWGRGTMISITLPLE